MFEKKTSEKKIASNRENAQKSTGPTSPEGKNTSRMNGRRHGFTGQVLLETDEDFAAYTQFTRQYIAALAPEGFIEIDLAHATADAAWRLNRMRAHENNYLSARLASDGPMIETDHAQVHTALTHTTVVFEKSKELCNIALYEQRLNRILHKNLQVLAEMKKSRILREAIAEKSMAAGSRRPASDLTNSTESTTSREIGFAFSRHNGATETPSISPRECRETAPPDAEDAA